MLKAYHCREGPQEKTAEETSVPVVSSVAVVGEVSSSVGKAGADEDGLVLQCTSAMY